MESLPHEILIDILLPLKYQDLKRACFTNKRYIGVCSDNYFWQRKLQRDYPKIYNETLNKPDIAFDQINWKEMYDYAINIKLLICGAGYGIREGLIPDYKFDGSYPLVEIPGPTFKYINVTEDSRTYSGNPNLFGIDIFNKVWGCGPNNYFGLGLDHNKIVDKFTDLEFEARKILSSEFYTALIDLDDYLWKFGAINMKKITYDNPRSNTGIRVKEIALDVHHLANSLAFIDLEDNLWLWDTFGVWHPKISNYGSNYPKQLRDNSNIAIKAKIIDFFAGYLYFTDLEDNLFMLDPTDYNIQIIPINIKVKQLAVGLYHLLAISMNDELLGKGSNRSWALGLDGRGVESFTKLSDFSVTKIAAGKEYSIVIDSENNVWASGNNDVNQCGLGDPDDVPDIYKWTKIPSVKATEVATGQNTTVFLAYLSE